MGVIVNILLLLLVISVLTCIHEFGHYLAARIVKAKVLDFSVGFGPKILSTKKNGIEYNFRALPFGGFVKILGDGDPSSQEENIKDSGNLKNKSKFAQVFVMLAGVTMNILLAFALYFIFISANNWKIEIGSDYSDFHPVGAVITKDRISDLPYELTKDSQAKESGLYEKGYIKSVNGKVVYDYSDFKKDLDGIKNTSVTLEACKYDSNDCNKFIVPVNQDGKIGMYIGSNYSTYIDYSKNKIFAGFSHSINVLKLTGEALSSMFAQAKQTGDYGSLSNTVSGPVGIYFVINYFKSLGLPVFLGMVADLSLSLAVINLLPIPALDGGRAFILLIEGILRKDIPEKVESFIINISFMLLVLLIIGIMVKDILNIDQLQSLFK